MMLKLTEFELLAIQNLIIIAQISFLTYWIIF